MFSPCSNQGNDDVYDMRSNEIHYENIFCQNLSVDPVARSSQNEAMWLSQITGNLITLKTEDITEAPSVSFQRPTLSNTLNCNRLEIVLKGRPRKPKINSWVTNSIFSDQNNPCITHSTKVSLQTHISSTTYCQTHSTRLIAGAQG